MDFTNLPPGAKLEIEYPDGRKEKYTVPTRQEIVKEKYAALIGQPITMTEAAQKYNVPRPTVENWLYQSKYIAPLDDTAYPKTFDEAQIAYLAEIYHERRKTGSLAPLLDENGLPYQIKNPDRAAKARDYRARRDDT